MSTASVSAILFAVFVVLAVVFQWSAGAYRADFWEYDESAHFVSSLMVHDYLRTGLGSSPTNFATMFEQHYPKVAIGHWPPVFHIALAVWMTIFSTSTPAALSFLAMAAAISAWIIYRMWRSRAGGLLAAGAATAFLVLPLVRDRLAFMMTELFLTLLILASVLLAERLLDRGSLTAGAAFGLAASLAILTKPNGWALPLVLIGALLISRRYSALARPGIWLSGAIVAVACLPWYAINLAKMKAGWTASSNVSYLASSVGWFNLSRPAFSLGIVVSLFAIAGLVRRSGLALRGGLDTRWSCALATVVGFWIFHTFVAPVQEPRHSIYSLPFLLAFACDGVNWSRERLRLSSRTALASALPLLVAAGFLVEKARIWRKDDYRSIPAAEWVLESLGPRPAAMLVSSLSKGESAFIASLAQRDQRPRHTVIRATQSLAWTAWAGQGYRQVLTSEEEIVAYLDQRKVSLVLWDTSPAKAEGRPHHALLHGVLQSRGDLFSRVAKVGPFDVWAVRARD